MVLIVGHDVVVVVVVVVVDAAAAGASWSAGSLNTMMKQRR